ncbi:MAG: hypothetical protein K2X01_07555 [Cyanobacteria bacterium]|nr:hypothetical protein [Cyanobacteriota bacterium]
MEPIKPDSRLPEVRNLSSRNLLPQSPQGPNSVNVATSTTGSLSQAAQNKLPTAGPNTAVSTATASGMLAAGKMVTSPSQGNPGNMGGNTGGNLGGNTNGGRPGSVTSGMQAPSRPITGPLTPAQRDSVFDGISPQSLGMTRPDRPRPNPLPTIFPQVRIPFYQARSTVARYQIQDETGFAKTLSPERLNQLEVDLTQVAQRLSPEEKLPKGQVRQLLEEVLGQNGVQKIVFEAQGQNILKEKRLEPSSQQDSALQDDPLTGVQAANRLAGSTGAVQSSDLKAKLLAFLPWYPLADQVPFRLHIAEYLQDDRPTGSGGGSISNLSVFIQTVQLGSYRIALETDANGALLMEVGYSSEAKAFVPVIQQVLQKTLAANAAQNPANSLLMKALPEPSKKSLLSESAQEKTALPERVVRISPGQGQVVPLIRLAQQVVEAICVLDLRKI